jgi:hypothetical protein
MNADDRLGIATAIVLYFACLVAIIAINKLPVPLNLAIGLLMVLVLIPIGVPSRRRRG